MSQPLGIAKKAQRQHSRKQVPCSIAALYYQRSYSQQQRHWTRCLPAAQEDIAPVSRSTASPTISASVCAAEILEGRFWNACKASLPRVRWGPAQLGQVMLGSAGLACLLLTLVNAAIPAAPLGHTTGAQLVTATADAAELAKVSSTQADAVRHIASEAALLLTAGCVAAGLRDKTPGSFVFNVPSHLLPSLLALSLILFPTVDPLLYSGWSSVVQGLAGQATPVSQLVTELHSAAAEGDAGALSMHVLASCLLGPLWEETFWRGFFLLALTKVLPLPACVACSSLGFASLHLSPFNALPILLVSSICDMLYLRTASLGPSLLVHALYNSYQVVGIVLLGKDTFV